MKLGIKIAPGNAWKAHIEATRPAMVEIWYNASRPNDYLDMFDYLTSKPIDIGLHFWGALPNGTLATLSYPDQSVADASMELMKATIDQAKQHGASYVNIHPDLTSLLSVNLKTLDIRVASEPADTNTCIRTFLDKVTALNAYAQKSQVLLTVETIPSRDTPTWNPNRDRTKVININPIPFRVFDALAARGIALANDISHTACQIRSEHRSDVLSFVRTWTTRFAQSTRLIHIGFIIPPYNGVDYHNSLENPVFQSDLAVPNKNEMRELLKLFIDRNDVWALVEPSIDHVKNYFLAGELLPEKRG